MKKVSPVTVRHDGPIATLFINTPNSSVNIFTRSLATEILKIYENLDPNQTRLVVFRSSKPYSFLNGAELTLTQSIKTIEDVHSLTQITAKAYQTVAESPIPSVAAIEGNCFGCGVEFTLCCDYRVTSDTFDTRIYMTELRDYYLLPLFGSLQKLPRLVGLQGACDLLIKGETWGCYQAQENGLTDQVLSHDSFGQDLQAFCQKLLSSRDSLKRRLHVKEQPFARLEKSIQTAKEVEASVLEWIHKLPKEHHALHKQCLDILLQEIPNYSNHSNGKKDPSKKASEDLVDTLSTEASRNAAAFFFVKSMARVSNLQTSDLCPPHPVRLKFHQNSLHPDLVAAFSQRTLRDLKVEVVHPKHSNFITMKFRNGFGTSLKPKKTKYAGSLPNHEFLPNAPSIGPKDSIIQISNRVAGSIQIKTFWGYHPELKDTETSSDIPILYFPFGTKAGLCELRVDHRLDSSNPTDELLLSFCQTLYHLGWECVISSDLHSLVNPYLKVIEVHIKEATLSGHRSELKNQWNDFGFEKTAEDFEESLGILRDVSSTKPDSSHSPQERKTKSNPESFLEDLFKDLKALSETDLKSKRVRNRSVIDLIIHFCLGYPKSKGGFFRYTQKRSTHEESRRSHGSSWGNRTGDHRKVA